MSKWKGKKRSQRRGGGSYPFRLQSILHHVVPERVSQERMDELLKEYREARGIPVEREN